MVMNDVLVPFLIFSRSLVSSAQIIRATELAALGSDVLAFRL